MPNIYSTRTLEEVRKLTVDVEVDRGTALGLYPVAGSHQVSPSVITLRPGNRVASGATDRLLRH